MNEILINPFSIALLIMALLALTAAAYVWRRRPAPGATPLVVFLWGAALWSGAYAFEFASTTLKAKIFWVNIEYIGIVLAPTMLLFLVLQYTDKYTRLKTWQRCLFAIEPMLVLLLLWTNAAHGLIWQSAEMFFDGTIYGIKPDYGTGFWIHTAYSYLILFAGVVLLVQAYRRASAIYRSQTGAILAGTLVPWVANALYIFNLNPFPQIDLTPFAFTITGLMTTWGLFRLRLFDLTPLAREVIFESLADGVIVLDLDARIIDINPAAQRIINTRNKIIGQPAGEVLSAWPDLIQQFGDVTQAETQISLMHAGSLRYFNLRISPVYDRSGQFTGRIILLQDVTESRLAQEQLRRLSRAVEQSASTIVVTNVNGEIEYVNPAFALTTGYTVEEALGENPRILKSGKMPAEIYAEMWEVLGKDEVWQGELINKKKNGELYWETASISPVKNNRGETTHYVAVKDDITLRKQMEDELVVTRDKALEANRLKGQILANVSHDMHTPLGAIVGYTEMLQNEVYGPLNQQQKEKLDVLLQSTNQLLDFVGNLLGQSELASGELTIQQQRVRPRKLIEEMQSVTRVLAERKGLALTSEVAPDVPDQLIGDNYWIQRIITNLVSNAVKFTQEGSIQVQALLSADQKRWAIRVSDTGAGISPEAQAYIFEPFRKGDETAGIKSTGAGLGLAIVQEVVGLMHGEITLESEIEKGSIFTVYLPLELERKAS